MSDASLVGFAGVVLANSFNPSIVREHWLIEHKFLQENSIKPGFLFTEQAVRLPTNEFVMLLVPPHLQFIPVSRDEAFVGVQRFLKPLVLALPETPFTAVGITFVWRIDTGPASSFGEITRRLFLAPGHRLTDEFAAEDARFGAYMSKNVNNCRLRLDMKPVKSVEADGGGLDYVDCTFNFHLDVVGASAPATQIGDHLDRWPEYDLLSERLARLVTEAAK